MGVAVVPQAGPCDRALLQQTWTSVTGYIAADGLADLARLIDEACTVLSPSPPADEYAEKLIRAFVTWVDGCHPSRRPQKSPRRLIANSARIQAIVAGEQPAGPEERPTVRRLTGPLPVEKTKFSGTF